MNSARQVVTYLCSCTLMLTAQPRAVVRPQATDPHDGQRDFDFEIGRWGVHNARLLHPLTGDTAWIQFEGTSVARPVWNGRADLLELESETPTGHAEGLI